MLIYWYLGYDRSERKNLVYKFYVTVQISVLVISDNLRHPILALFAVISLFTYFSLVILWDISLFCKFCCHLG